MSKEIEKGVLFEELIREAVKQYLDAGGDEKFYIISRSDYDKSLLYERWRTLGEVNDLRVTMSEQQGKPYVVIDDMKQGGKTVFAGRLEFIQKNDLVNLTNKDNE